MGTLEDLEAARTTAAGVPVVRSAGWVVPGLARVEGHRLLRHPAFLLTTTLSLVMATSGRGIDFSVLVLSGWASAAIALGVALAANLAASRSRRDGTDELFASLPADERARTTGHLLSVAWAVVAGAVLLVIVAAAIHAGGGPAVRLGGSVRDHSLAPAELAQGPLVIATMGVVAVALGRLWPSRLIGSALAVAPLLVVQFLGGDRRWFGAWVNHADTVPDGYWPHPEIAPATDLVGFDVVSLNWHLLYLTGLAALAITVALGRGRASFAVVGTAVAALAMAIVGGVAQLR
ncbi:MAG TPA: hypothetical protein VNT56_08430 [Acidimicrobiales bacterium]|nr:hypothetical protein [Acidimicrobiales bacterium]